MTCSSCGNALDSIDYKGIEINTCKSCGSMWFDRDELRQVKDREEKIVSWLDTDLFSDPSLFKANPVARKCPRDGIQLYGIVYDNTGVTVDICDTCQGVWLEKGEFQKIVAYLKDEVLNKKAGEYLAAFAKEAEELAIGSEPLGSELADMGMVAKLLSFRIAAQWPGIEDVLQALRASLLK